MNHLNTYVITAIIMYLIPSSIISAQNCLSNPLTSAGVHIANTNKADLQLGLDAFVLSHRSLSVTLTVTNLSSLVSSTAGVPITFYDADPTLTNASVVAQYLVPDAIVSTQPRTYTRLIDLSSLPYMPFYLFAVIGDDGLSQRPFLLDDQGNGTNSAECFFANNKASFATIVPLPIELLEFGVESVSENDFLFKWQTATEHDNRGFYLEIAKGSAELSNFTSVAFVAGQGNALTATNYTHSLWDLVPGQYYARLRQVDFSGEHSYSSIVSFRVYGSAPLVYPTIVGVNGKVNIVLSNAGEWSAGLYDAEGRLLQTGQWLLEEGESVTGVMSVEGLVPGFYFIQIEERSTGVRWTEKLVMTKDW